MINTLVGEIASAAQEQATGLQQVNVAVNQMDQVVQQNAAMVEESTAASHTLSQEATNLSDLMGQFQRLGLSTPRPSAAARSVGAPRHPVHAAQSRAAQMISPPTRSNRPPGRSSEHDRPAQRQRRP